MKRSKGARKSGRVFWPGLFACVPVVAAMALLSDATLSRAAAGDPDRPGALAETDIDPPASSCTLRLRVELDGAPAERAPRVGAAWLAALGAGAEGAAWLALVTAAGAWSEVESAGTPRGAVLHLTVTGPASAEALLRAFVAHAAASFPRSFVGGDGLSRSLFASQAATAVLFPRRAADADPDSAEARLSHSLERASVAVSGACDPASVAPTAGDVLITSDGMTVLPPQPSGDPRRASFFLVMPVPPGTRPEDLATLSAWLSHPGSEFGRRLAAPPLRLGPVSVTHLAVAGVLVANAPLPLAADVRAARHDLLRILPSLRPSPTALRGAARLSGHPAPERHLAGRLADHMLSVHRAAVVAIAADPAFAMDVPALDAEARDRFVAAAVELRCPAPSDDRPAESRLKDKMGMDGQTWRLLAREVAADAALATALEQEVADRCGALGRLRRRISPALFERIYRAYRCQIMHLTDEDQAFEAGRSLLAGLGLDSAWLTPILEMASGDPRLERIRLQVDASCAEPPRGGTR